jgi:hypothetical protein
MRSSRHHRRKLVAIACTTAAVLPDYATTQRMNPDSSPRPAPRYLMTEEAAEFLRLSARTLEKHRNTGTGPRYRKLGRRVCYTIADLEAWAEAQDFAMTSDPDYADACLGTRGKRRRRNER